MWGLDHEEGHKKPAEANATFNLTNIYQNMASSLHGIHPMIITLLASVSNLESLNGRKSAVFFWGSKIYLEENLAHVTSPTKPLSKA